MLETFREELIQTGYIHSPLPLHPERSLEAEQAAKEVLERRIIWNGANLQGSIPPAFSGIGTLAEAKGAGRDGGDTLRVTAPTARDTAPYEDGATAAQFRSMLTFSRPST